MKVAIYGAGQVGSEVARLVTQEGRHTVHGPFTRAHRDQALASGADVVVIATTSFLSAVGPDLRLAVNSGSNVITTAEEAAFPWAYAQDLADEVDGLARDRHVSVVGAGLNPGFIFDALVLTASGVTSGVTHIKVERTVDLSGFSVAILKRLGIGFSAADFVHGATDGTVTGHIGFPQSMRLVAKKMGVALTEIERHIEPMLAETTYQTQGLTVPPGESAGFRQRYCGTVNGHPWFEALFLGHLDPEGVGHSPRDTIQITGDFGPPLQLRVEPGVNPQVGAPRIVANSLERLVAAPPGWITVADLPPAAPSGLGASRTAGNRDVL